jgi:hypothetical protein
MFASKEAWSSACHQSARLHSDDHAFFSTASCGLGFQYFHLLTGSVVYPRFVKTFTQRVHMSSDITKHQKLNSSTFLALLDLCNFFSSILFLKSRFQEVFGL